MDNNFKRQIILENYQEPMNRGLVNDTGYIKTNTSSDSCIDNLDVMMKIENGIINDIRFDGEACTICTSAISILIRNLIGKNVSEAKKILINYYNMINEKEYDKDIIGDLIVYDEISKQPNRINCALLPHNAISKLIEEINKNGN